MLLKDWSLRAVVLVLISALVVSTIPGAFWSQPPARAGTYAHRWQDITVGTEDYTIWLELSQGATAPQVPLHEAQHAELLQTIYVTNNLNSRVWGFEEKYAVSMAQNAAIIADESWDEHIDGARVGDDVVQQENTDIAGNEYTIYLPSVLTPVEMQDLVSYLSLVPTERRGCYQDVLMAAIFPEIEWDNIHPESGFPQDLFELEKQLYDEWGFAIQCAASEASGNHTTGSSPWAIDVLRLLANVHVYQAREEQAQIASNLGINKENWAPWARLSKFSKMLSAAQLAIGSVSATGHVIEDWDAVQNEKLNAVLMQCLIQSIAAERLAAIKDFWLAPDLPFPIQRHDATILELAIYDVEDEIEAWDELAAAHDLELLITKVLTDPDFIFDAAGIILAGMAIAGVLTGPIGIAASILVLGLAFFWEYQVEVEQYRTAATCAGVAATLNKEMLSYVYSDVIFSGDSVDEYENPLTLLNMANLLSYYFYSTVNNPEWPQWQDAYAENHASDISYPTLAEQIQDHKSRFIDTLPPAFLATPEIRWLFSLLTNGPLQVTVEPNKPLYYIEDDDTIVLMTACEDIFGEPQDGAAITYTVYSVVGEQGFNVRDGSFTPQGNGQYSDSFHVSELGTRGHFDVDWWAQKEGYADDYGQTSFIVASRAEGRNLRLNYLEVSPVTTRPGMSVNISCQVKNVGVESEEAYVEVGIVGPGYTLTTERYHLGTLDPSESTSLERVYTWNVPSDAEYGYYSIHVTASTWDYGDEDISDNVQSTSVYVGSGTTPTYKAYEYETIIAWFNPDADYSASGPAAQPCGACGPVDFYNPYNSRHYEIAVVAVRDPQGDAFWLYVARDDNPAPIVSPAGTGYATNRSHYFDNNQLMIILDAHWGWTTGCAGVPSGVLLKVGSPCGSEPPSLTPYHGSCYTNGETSYDLCLPPVDWMDLPLAYTCDEATQPRVRTDDNPTYISVSPRQQGEQCFEVRATNPPPGLTRFALDCSGSQNYIVFGELEAFHYYDATVTSISSSPLDPKSSDIVTITSAVNNLGSAALTGIEVTTTVSGPDGYVCPLPVQTTDGGELIFEWDSIGAPEGDYMVTTSIHHDTDMDPSNNWLTKEIHLNPPPRLVVSAVTDRDVYQQGAEVGLYAVVKDDADAFFASAQVTYIVRDYIGREVAHGIAYSNGDGSYSATFASSWSLTQSTDYIIEVLASSPGFLCGVVTVSIVVGLPPNVCTLTASWEDATSATLCGNLTSLGTASSVDVSFEWGTTQYGEAIGNYTVGDDPIALAFDGTNIWVANYLSGNVMKLRASDGCLVDTHPVGSGPRALAFDGDCMWVANELDNTVIKLRMHDGKVLDTLYLGARPIDLAFDGEHIWVTKIDNDNGTNDYITRIRISDGHLDNYEVGRTPCALVFDGDYVFVANWWSHNIMKLDPSDGHILATYDLIPHNGPYPAALCYGGDSIWVACFGGTPKIIKLNPNDDVIAGVYELIPRAYVQSLAFDGEHIWAAAYYGNWVYRIRVSDGEILDFYNIGPDDLYGILFDGTDIWVASWEADRVIKLRVNGYGHETQAVTVTSNGEFSILVPGLESGPMYRFRAKASGHTIHFGQEQTFIIGCDLTVKSEGCCPVTVNLLGTEEYIPSGGTRILSDIPYGTEVAVIADDSDWWCDFTNWTGDVAEPYASSTTVTVESDKSVTAHCVARPVDVIFHEDFNDGDVSTDPTWDVGFSKGCMPSTAIVEIESGELHIIQQDTRSCGNAAWLSMDLNEPINGRGAVLQFDVKSIYSNVAEGSGYGNTEYPARVDLLVQDETGQQRQLLVGYSYRGGASETTEDMVVIGYGDVPQGIWLRDQVIDLWDYWPDYWPEPVTIQKILLVGSGWAYESRFDNVSLYMLPPPQVVTVGISGLTTSSVTLYGSLEECGFAHSVQVSFEWGLDTTYGNETTSEDMISIGNFSTSIDDLNPGTTYHFRAKAVGNGTNYGDDMSLTTLSPQIQIPLEAGWNMVSVPVTPEHNSVSAVFPGVAAVFTWDAVSGTYYMPTSIDPDTGYWVAVIEDGNITVSGTPVETWTTDIKAGWNMIGSIINDASIADPDDDPDGSVQPFAYWWDPMVGTYILTTDINAGKGYWVASLQDCTLTVP